MEPAMGSLPLSRLTLVGLFFLLPGFYFALRFGSGFVRVLSRKFRRGKPYLKGSATDYFLYAAFSLGVALVGGGLTLASALQAGFQPLSAPREVGKVRAESPQPGRIRLILDLAKDYPRHPNVIVDVPGVRWALEGEFLRWKLGPRWLGFRNGHRIEAALGSTAPSGPPDRQEDARGIVSGTYPLWYLSYRHPRWVPTLRTRLRRTPWMPAEGQAYRIFAGEAGYVLVEDKEKRPSGS